MTEKPKKERRFLKAIGRVGEILIQEVLIKIGSNLIKKIGGKKTLPSILFLLASLSLFAQYPNTGNKQRLGFQTTGDGLTWRGSESDTASIQPINNTSAWVILDTVNLKFYSFDFTSNVWNSVGGAAFTQPVDSLFFNVNVPTNNVDTAKMRWDSDLATVVLGLNDNVSNELGFKNFWLVKNQTGSTITKGSLVYANGTVGASGRITIDKFIADGSIDAKYLLGITAHDLSNGEDGYVISFGKIRKVNTDTFAAGAILYPSPTVAGVWTDVEPIAPNLDMPIGFCINSHANNGTIAIRVASGYKLSELHDVAISSPVEKASLYYSGGLWRDTTAALLVSDTAAMLANYALKGYVDSIAQNFQDSIDEITNGYYKQEFASVTKDTLNWIKPVQLPIGGSNLLLVYRNGQMINDAQYSVIDTNKVKINSGSYKVGENYTVVYVKGGGGSGSGGASFDTSVLNLQARLDLKLNISDTASMLSNYATKEYADTTGRFYARQDFTNVSSSTLTWTQSDTLIPAGVTVVQVYRNGQILLPTQYTIPTSTSVVIAATSYKVGENYTVIFPRGGGAGSGGGSGSLTSISGGTGILVSPDPITTTGTVSADLSVLMELTDTSLLNLTSRLATKLNISDTAAMLLSYNTRIDTKLNISDTASMLSPYFRDADTSLLNLTSRFALKLNADDTASLSSRIDAKGTGTVTSVATGYGITGGTITTTGTLVLDSAVVFSQIRDSIVDVAIGNDTIKILKQEYAPATTSVLTWTITPKFPIQLKVYILVFRNGQLLINDQYNLTDTNQITIVSNSFKVGANYTVVTVSGIGSVGTGVFPNPVYPEAGIALSTGSAWASSIPNNSANWNIAFNDKINNAAFTGTTTKTLTLTQYDGGTFTPTFNDLQGVTEVTAGTGLTGGTITSTGTVAVDFTTVAPLASPEFTGTVSGITNSMVGLGNVDNTSDANKPISTATQTALNLKVNISDSASMLTPYLRKADTSLLNLTSRFAAKLNISDTASMLTNYLRSGVAASTYQTKLSGTGFVKASGTNITYDNSSYLRTGLADSSYLKLSGGTLTGSLSVLDSISIGSLSQYSSRFTRYLKTSNISPYRDLFIGSVGTIGTWAGRMHFQTSYNTEVPTTAMTINEFGNINMNGTLSVTGDITEGGNNVLTNLDTASLSSRINTKFNTDDTTQLNLTSRFATKLNISDTASMLTNYLQSGVAASTYLPLTGGTLTGDLYAKYLNTFAKTTYIPFNANIGEQSIFNVGTVLRGGTVMVFPDSNLVGSSANIFLANSSVQGVESSAMGSGMRNYKQGDIRRNSLAFYTSGIGSQNTNRLFIDYDGNVGINDDTPSYKLDVNGTLNATGATTLGSTLAVTDAVTLSTTTATPTSLLGKDDSNVVGTVTTVAQTGLMKAGSVTQNTSSVGIISVAHGLSYEPTQVIVTLAQQNSYIVVCHDITATTLFFTVYDSVTGNPLNNISVGIFWLAIK